MKLQQGKLMPKLLKPATSILPLLFMLSACGEGQNLPLRELKEGETVVVRIEMPARTERQMDIPTTEPMAFYLDTNASFALMRKYNSAKRLPVRLEHRKAIESISTVKGAGVVLFEPIDGIIPIALKNETSETLTVRVIRKPITHDTE